MFSLSQERGPIIFYTPEISYRLPFDLLALKLAYGVGAFKNLTPRLPGLVKRRSNSTNQSQPFGVYCEGRLG